MSADKDAIKVFISYSWKPTAHKEKVIKLAERLTADGIHVIIDDWDLKEGQEKNQFMEQMVNDPTVKRVLLICNKEYAEKANARAGGVGIESLIISNEIYSKADQTKFIPVIFEYDKENKPYTPTFVTSRIFIDLSNDNVFEENYEQLMRNLFDKPKSKRPPLGTPPIYISDEEPIFLPTAHKVATIKHALNEEKKNAILLIQDYYDSFIKALDNYGITLEEVMENKDTCDENIIKRINELSALRDDFINFITTYVSNSVEVDVDRLHNFFEKCLTYLYNLEGFDASENTLNSITVDHYRFFFYDLMLNFTAIMLEKEKFKELGYILHNTFTIHLEKNNDVQALSFTSFRNHVWVLNRHRNSRLNLRRVNLVADMIKSGASTSLSFEKLQQADLLLFYISLLLPDADRHHRWFPDTSCYRFYSFPVTKKAISQRYFDKIKPILNVSDKDELIEKTNIVSASGMDNVGNGYYQVAKIKVALNVENLCMIK
jgi:hypothetical protein